MVSPVNGKRADQVTFVTSHGRRVAAVVPVAVAEAVPGAQADADTDTAQIYAVNVAIIEVRAGVPVRVDGVRHFLRARIRSQAALVAARHAWRT
jgi:hypothetical protein